MADSSLGANTPDQTADFTFDFADTMHELHDDAERTWLAMSAVVQLLNGCDHDHALSAGGLLCLLEPIAGCMETLAGDVGMAKNHFSFKKGIHRVN